MLSVVTPSVASVTFDVLFLSPVTGRWKLQHSFIGREHALACGENLSAMCPALVFEVSRRDGHVVAEKQIASFERRVATEIKRQTVSA